jgi:hypothetical protein
MYSRTLPWTLHGSGQLHTPTILAAGKRHAGTSFRPPFLDRIGRFLVDVRPIFTFVLRITFIYHL